MTRIVLLFSTGTMMMRLLCLPISLFLAIWLHGPAAAQSQPDTLLLSLTPQEGLGPFPLSLGGMSDVDAPGERWHGLHEPVHGIPDTLHDAELRFHDFDFVQLTYQRYRQGALDADHVREVFATWGTDTLALSPEPLRTSVAVLVGQTADSAFAAVFDTDNDGDLSDETLHVATEADTLKPFREGIEVRVAYEFYDGERIHQATAPLFVHRMQMGPRQMYMSGSFRHARGTATDAEGIAYTWYVSPGTRNGAYQPDQVEVLVLPAGAPLPSKEDRVEPYHIGEVVDFGGTTYRIDHVELDGSALRLVAAPEAVVGLRTGQQAPEVTAVTLAGDTLRTADLHGRYVLLDFWGTWCGPCIGEVPNLKAAYNAYRDAGFMIVGIAHDAPDAVAEFIDEHAMPWPQIIQERGDDPVLAAFRIQGYPTTFLLDPEGQIVAKDEDLRGKNLADTLERHLGTSE